MLGAPWLLAGCQGPPVHAAQDFCGEIPSEDSAGEGDTGDGGGGEIPEGLTDQITALPTGGYAVQEDMYFDSLIDAVRVFDPDYGVRSIVNCSNDNRPARDHIWNVADALSLTYCIQTFQDPSVESAARSILPRATAFWERAADVNFIHLPEFDGPGCDASIPEVRFYIRQGTEEECDGDCPGGRAASSSRDANPCRASLLGPPRAAAGGRIAPASSWSCCTSR